MKNLFSFLIYFALFASALYGQKDFTNHKVNMDSLVRVSQAVILSDDHTFEINSHKDSEYSVHLRILIKNKGGEKYCKVRLLENEYREVNDIEAAILDTNQRTIKTLDTDDIEENEISSGYVLYAGNSYKSFSLTHNTYPYIFECSYRVDIKSLFFWHDWYPQDEVPVLSSSYKLILHTPISFNYYSVGIDTKPEKNLIGEDSVYTWKLEKIPPRLHEDYMPPESEEQMALYFKSANFILDEYEGNSISWNSFAQWYRDLTKERYELPPAAKDEISNRIKNITDPKEKIKSIYKLHQEKNKYTAIEMGIRGWQPQPAADVYKNRYGDCKDLTTYMVAALKTIGIESYPALALTRDNGIVNKDFPSPQFNHCILCVPLSGDTLWIETTNPYLELGDVPYSIEDIDVLVVKENSGKLERTSVKKSSENVFASTLEGTIDLTGNLNFKTEINTTGNRKNYFKEYLISYDDQDDLEFLHDQLTDNYRYLSLQNFSTQEIFDKIHKYVITLNGVYNKFLPMVDKRVFVNPAIINRKNSKSLPGESVSERKFPVFFSYPYQIIDSVAIELPLGYTLESKPKGSSFENSFGKYFSSFEFNNGKLFYKRFYEIKMNLISLEQYKDFIEFLKQVIAADKTSFVLLKE